MTMLTVKDSTSTPTEEPSNGTPSNENRAAANKEQATDKAEPGSNQESILPVPKSNTVYGTKDYWEERFSQEKDYEWLLSYEKLSSQLGPHLQPDSRILVVGCGNSPFSADLYDAGYTNILNIDYSEVVIAAMRQRHGTVRPVMQWKVLDMTDLSELKDASFDVVIDKAAMDAIMTAEGDVWNPDVKCIDQSRAMCGHVSRVLASNGTFLQISLAQPHFRKLYLLGWHGNEEADRSNDSYCPEFNWSFCTDVANKDSDVACFGHFLYVMQKSNL